MNKCYGNEKTIAEVKEHFKQRDFKDDSNFEKINFPESNHGKRFKRQVPTSLTSKNHVKNILKILINLFKR